MVLCHRTTYFHPGAWALKGSYGLNLYTERQKKKKVHAYRKNQNEHKDKQRSRKGKRPAIPSTLTSQKFLCTYAMQPRAPTPQRDISHRHGCDPLFCLHACCSSALFKHLTHNISTVSRTMRLILMSNDTFLFYDIYKRPQIFRHTHFGNKPPKSGISH